MVTTKDIKDVKPGTTVSTGDLVVRLVDDETVFDMAPPPEPATEIDNNQAVVRP